MHEQIITLSNSSTLAFFYEQKILLPVTTTFTSCSNVRLISDIELSMQVDKIIVNEKQVVLLSGDIPVVETFIEFNTTSLQSILYQKCKGIVYEK